MTPSSHLWLQCGHVEPKTSFLSRFEKPNLTRQARLRRAIPALKRKHLIHKHTPRCARESDASEQAVATTPQFDADIQTDKPTDEVGCSGHVVSIRTLELESTYEMAISSLLREIESLARGVSTTSPGQPACLAEAPAATIRIEVPLPRGMTALQWLKAQSDAPMAVYFSSKMSSAPDTAGSIVAESSFSSVSSIAGLGHAWMWRGCHGYGLDPHTMAEIATMTDEGGDGDMSRCDIKVLGGSRFDPGGVVGQEWDAFGSFCFLIPRIEFAERGNGCVLACTLVWDARAGDSTEKTGRSVREVHGFRTMQDAIRDALRCISELNGVGARNSAGVIMVGGAEILGSMRHVPDERGWHALMDQVQRELAHADQGERPPASDVDSYTVQPTAALDEYLRNGQKGLDELLAASKTTSMASNGSKMPVKGSSEESVPATSLTGSALSAGSVAQTEPTTSASGPQDRLVKLVLARKTSMVFDNEVNCCDLLEAIQEKDPKAYQFMLRLPADGHPHGGVDQRTFLGCTPERLYCRTSRQIVSEAVAGTRGRGPGGDIEKDFWLAFDLLQSQKDGLEFQLVRESIVETFDKLCDTVDLEVEKSVLKQGSVQHLYGRIAGSLKPGVDDLDLIRELHPTPAVCGQPDQDAMCLLRSFESFDRGFYAGPFGWFSKNAADIAVAIRSTLVGTDCVDLYAGVGIVPGSITSSEWNELDLKISQFTNVFKNSTQERIMSSQNVSILAAQLMVEELCRCGCNTFCVAPGSRSSPLTLAVAQHPRARLVPGIDERSLGFWALGHGKATGRPCAVITSSGTAVANLLPAVVEASQSDVPLLLLTADRPAELRDSGANQTIDQVGIFGKYVRWEADLLAPSADIPLRSTLAAVSNGVRIAMSSSKSGPVHLNCQFREPLHPATIDWANRNTGGMDDAKGSPAVLQGLDTWITDAGRRAFTSAASSVPPANHALSSSTVDQSTLHKIMTASRGLIVVGELADPVDVSAAKQIASYLRWPIVGDVLSGLRIGAGSPLVTHETEDSECATGATCRNGVVEDEFQLINYMDHVLLGGADTSSCDAYWGLIKPDVVLHLGSRLTSKRLLAFLEWATQQEDPATWILANRKTTRYDPANVLDVRLECSVAELHRALKYSGFKRPVPQDYGTLLTRLDAVAGDAIAAALDDAGSIMSEAHVARVVSDCLPEGDGLFVGNSMPIRDLDMFGGRRATLDPLSATLVGAPVAANRGASGIDGVLSSAVGFADGLQRKCTLVIGDVSFIHDTNGLNLLRTGGMSPALTVVLINNSGGGIFNFLPISGGVPDEQFRPLWTTPQYVDIAGMCRAQGIPHMRVTSLSELETSLKSSWALNRHCVLEVVTNIESNVNYHEDIKIAVSRALDADLQMLPGVSSCKVEPQSETSITITRVRVTTASFPLKQPLTTLSGSSSTSRDVAYMLVDAICSDGTPRTVIGEIAPLPGLHRETLEEAVAQATLVAEKIMKNGSDRTFSPRCLDVEHANRGAAQRAPLGTVTDGFGRSLLESLGVASDPLYPSVSCGLQAAMFQLCIAERSVAANGFHGSSTKVSTLLNPHGKSAEEIAAEAHALVMHQGYNCIKVKAGRSRDPETDAEYLKVIRQAVGPGVTLRVDANQAWNVEQASKYVASICDQDVEYLEEPLSDPMALFDWDSLGVPIALDESIDRGTFQLLDSEPLPTSVKVVVIKPSLVGGISMTIELARKAAGRGLRTVISSSFESPVGLLHLSQIAKEVDEMQPSNGHHAHGISTESWFQGDYSGLTCPGQGVPGRLMPASLCLEYNDTTSLVTGNTNMVPSTSFKVVTRHVVWNVTQEISAAAGSIVAPQAPPIVLLHGMFGSAAEMHGLARALRQRCVGTPVLCVDLPGHGQSRWTQAGLDLLDASDSPNMLDIMSESLNEFLQDDRIGRCTLVGYSLGARVALSAYLRTAKDGDSACGCQTVTKLVTLSGGLGIPLKDHEARASRAAKDDAIADAFENLPRQEFFDTWYAATLWDSMRTYPGFEKYVAAKASQTQDAQHVLSATLRACSPGRTAPLRDLLESSSIENESNTKQNNNIVMMVGEKDATYMNMASTLDTSTCDYLRLVTVQGVGHAMHLESPDAVASLIAHHLENGQILGH